MSLLEFISLVIKLGRCPDISIDIMLEDLYKTQSHENEEKINTTNNYGKNLQ